MKGKKLLAGAAALAVAGVCVSSAVRDESLAPPSVSEAGPVRLVAFDSCDNAVTELRRAMAPYVTAYGVGSGNVMFAESTASDTSAGVAQKSVPDARAATPPEQQQDHSTTNVHEKGVDEPDIVKTDGKRVFSIADGKLRVIDVASRSVTGTVDLGDRRAHQLLVSGDRALVVVDNAVAIEKPSRPPGRPSFAPYSGTELVLVDLKGLKEIGSLRTDGSYLDARQVGGTARVVVRSQPRIPWVYPDQTTNEAGSLRRNREILQNEPITSWLPRYELSENGTQSSGTLVDCANVSHPVVHSGTSMLTVLSFDLSGKLGTGQPVSIVADGDTVYGTGRSLYVADDHRLLPRLPSGPPIRRPVTTAIHQFDISRAGPPKHVASGEVGGTLLNQYSLSEHEGILRVATTTGNENRCCWRMPADVEREPAPSESFVTTLRRDGATLTKVGEVGGLGKGERIYSVRFIGRMGYVVTFRQTDPLYTLDLADPARPEVLGELKITGFSAYLHPAGDGRLIGVGQEATEQGRTTGTQVSLFDVSDPAAPKRLDQRHLRNTTSEAQFDPHAFLYWPQDGTLVIPVSDYHEVSSLVLRVDGDRLRDVGTIVEPDDEDRGGQRRTIVIGDQLWSVSAAGAQVTARDGLTRQAWLPFTP
ncbi:Secreted protein containing C-terminal beta-propeller domain [Lentzea fradiae]|uniref:Secreted protein containing C-terminal beta-propeller domain n=1 Tax=Lentzea fradiae TaxID=200378 RepID=A0A1G7Y457_9PSEU|nr:beta-propeller domain-containing protein [Lentzea fradiae]SDG91268.1 Secreted protein containing C-terminal beta-propeller domain [Lentzea fradiae]